MSARTLYVALAILVLILSLPLLFGLVPPNAFYGVRTAKTLANADNWYRSNRFAGGAFLVASIVSLWLLRSPITIAASVSPALILVVPVVCATIASILFAQYL